MIRDKSVFPWWSNVGDVVETAYLTVSRGQPQKDWIQHYWRSGSYYFVTAYGTDISTAQFAHYVEYMSHVDGVYRMHFDCDKDPSIMFHSKVGGPNNRDNHSKEIDYKIYDTNWIAHWDISSQLFVQTRVL